MLWKEIAITQAGIKGEENILFELRNSGMDMFIMRDIYLECGDLSAQIDFYIVTPKMNIIVECKNLVGDIEIDNKGNFIRSFDDGRKKWKEGIYSPVTQNERHLTVLKNIRIEKGSLLAKMGIAFFSNFNKSLVVLANPKTILKDPYAPAAIRKQVIRADHLIDTIKKMNQESTELKSSKQDMRKIAERILSYNIEDRALYTKRYENFVALIKSEKKEPIQTDTAAPDPTSDNLCPRCGGRLIVRTGKYGPFWGCSNFPKCRYTNTAMH